MKELVLIFKLKQQLVFGICILPVYSYYPSFFISVQLKIMSYDQSKILWLRRV